MVPHARPSAAPPATPLRPRTLPPVPLSALATRIGVAPPDHPEVTVTGATLRASEVQPGDLFAALPGARAHGADFAADAVAAGAAAVLTDADGAARVRAAGLAHGFDVPVLVHDDPRAAAGPAAALVYGDPTRELAVIGITGTSGKTTVAHLVEAGLDAGERSTGLIGTVGTRINVRGRPPERLPSAFTTPEAPDLQALFAVMREEGVTDVVMEVSSHAIALHRVAGTRFVAGGFTNLSQDHLDFHRDMQDYFETKAKLFDHWAEKSVVCVDDAWGQQLAARIPDVVTVSGQGTPADWRGVDALTGTDGTQTATVLTPSGEQLPLALALPGAFNVSNALLALGLLAAVGVDPATAAAGLATVAVPGRMQRVDAGQPFLAVVDYAHKPAAVAALLDALRSEVAGRVLTVLGCGGDRDRGKRPTMGEAAATRSALLVVTDDNPRSEDPAAIRAEMLAGALAAEGRGEVREIGDRRAAIAAAVAEARPGDAVVVAGKGHETGQEIVGVKHPFDDVHELELALSRLGGGADAPTAAAGGR